MHNKDPINITIRMLVGRREAGGLTERGPTFLFETQPVMYVHVGTEGLCVCQLQACCKLSCIVNTGWWGQRQ